jgi:lipopolysaccharide heptosyltransferase I
MQPASFLIVRLSAIGDVIHALPVLDALRRARPDARIGWLVESASAPLLEHHPQLDVLHAIPRKAWRGASFVRRLRSEVAPFFRKLRDERWDVAIDLQGLTKSALAAFASGAPMVIGYGDRDAREASRWLYNRPVSPPPDARHVVARNLALLRGVGIEPPPDPCGRIGLLDAEREAAAASLRAAGWRGEPLVALNPGAGWTSKLWPTAHFAALGKLLHARHGARPLVLWGPKEEPLRDAVMAGLGGTGAIAAPETRLRELAAVIAQARLFVGGDTGPSHLAAVMGVPVVSLFGASDGHRNAPWPLAAGPMLQRADLGCVPCWKTRCPLKGAAELACLRGLLPERVADACAGALG